MVERSLSMREVPGSIPGFSTSFTFMTVNLFSRVPSQCLFLLSLFVYMCIFIVFYLFAQESQLGIDSHWLWG